MGRTGHAKDLFFISRAMGSHVGLQQRRRMESEFFSLRRCEIEGALALQEGRGSNSAGSLLPPPSGHPSPGLNIPICKVDKYSHPSPC